MDRLELGAAGACLLTVIAMGALASPARAAATYAITPARAANASPRAHCTSRGRPLKVGGVCRWRTILRFELPEPTRAAVLRVRMRTAHNVVILLRGPGTARHLRHVRRARRPRRVSFRLGALRRTTSLSLASGSRSIVRVIRADLVVPIATTSKTITSIGTPAPSGPQPPAPGPPAPGPHAVTAIPPTDGPAVWVSAADIAARPMSGPAWAALQAAADGSLGRAKIADQNSNHDVNTLAVALVYARTGVGAYRTKAAQAISAAIGTEAGGRTLALGRNLASYVIAADLIDLASYDPALDRRLRTWLTTVRTESLQGETLISTHETRPNNWGTMAGASRIAADLYLGDRADLARAAIVFRGYLGDRVVYAGFKFADGSWQASPAYPVGVNPPGAVRQGLSIDGALPEEMRRGCAFTLPPCHTDYPWEAMEGIVTQAELLSHHGYSAFAWSDNAVYRAAAFLARLDALYGGWWAGGDDAWQPWLINHAYTTQLPETTARPGKVLGWTDWVYGA